MKVKDREINKLVDVADKRCITEKRECYWPRPDPGVFVQGKGYRTRGSEVSDEYLCGNRAIRGCPDKYCNLKKNGERNKICPTTHKLL